MISYKNLTIIGTSHISRESVKDAEEAILSEKPEVVAIELDPSRMHALLTGAQGKPSIKDIRKFGLKGWLFAIAGGWIERKLGGKVGVAPGSEMLKAYKCAKKVNAKVALIDQDITITLKKFSKAITWREKWHFVVDLLTAKKVTFDLNSVPKKDVVAKLINEVKKRYPSVYRVLVAERNEHMARKLVFLMKNHASVIAIAGIGHEEEMMALVKKYLNKLDFIR